MDLEANCVTSGNLNVVHIRRESGVVRGLDQRPSALARPDRYHVSARDKIDRRSHTRSTFSAGRHNESTDTDCPGMNRNPNPGDSAHIAACRATSRRHRERAYRLSRLRLPRANVRRGIMRHLRPVRIGSLVQIAPLVLSLRRSNRWLMNVDGAPRNLQSSHAGTRIPKATNATRGPPTAYPRLDRMQQKPPRQSPDVELRDQPELSSC